MSTCFSGRCQPRGRVTTVGRRTSVRSAYAFPSGDVKASVPRAASRRCSTLPTTFGQVGLEASSRSANQTRAPELRALIAIFAGEAGPVISTRRSVSAGGGGGTDQSPSRMSRGAGQEVEPLAAGDPLPALVPRGEQLATARIEATVQFLHEGERLVGEDLLAARDLGVTGDLDGHAAALHSGDDAPHAVLIFAQMRSRRNRIAGNTAA